MAGRPERIDAVDALMAAIITMEAFAERAERVLANDQACEDGGYTAARNQAEREAERARNGDFSLAEASLRFDQIASRIANTLVRDRADDAVLADMIRELRERHIPALRRYNQQLEGLTS